MLRSNLCDYSDVYIVLIGTLTVKGNSNADTNKKANLKQSSWSFILKINNTLRDNAEDLVVLPIFNLLEYSNKLFYDIRKLVELYDADENNATKYRISNDKTTTSSILNIREK